MPEEKKQVVLGELVTVGDFAKLIDRPIGEVMGTLIKNGVMATVNETIDRDTAEIIASEYEISVVAEKSQKEKRAERSSLQGAELRPPIVAVMGHVDHGKTSLLDAIRQTDTAQDEAGGITQHISAYQVTHNSRRITFLDTPGHEAFAALRQYGAQLTDVAIIVVAADDGIKPQTIEAINFAKKAGVRMVVAINKIDKPAADANKVKTELSEKGLTPEEWGGDTVIAEVSAIQKTGLSELLDLVLLVADIEELKGDAEGDAEGIVIESYMKPGRGSVVRVLVEHGVMKKGDVVVAGSSYGKIRTLDDYRGEAIDEAGASTPATVSGFKELPSFGDVFQVVASEKEARKIASSSRRNQAIRSSDSIKTITDASGIDRLLAQQETNELPIVIKADVQGSLESVIQSLTSIESDEVAVNIVSSGVGSINETDITRASTSKAVIFGFNVDVPVNIKRLAVREQVIIRIHTIIYELIDETKEMLSKMLPPEIIETDIGRLKVKGIFRTTKSEIICGGEVTKGKITPKTLAKIVRNKQELLEAEVAAVQRGEIETKEVFEGDLCGIRLNIPKKFQILEGDVIEVFTREEKTRKLE